jgi:hypothetical protein
VVRALVVPLPPVGGSGNFAVPPVGGSGNLAVPPLSVFQDSLVRDLNGIARGEPPVVVPLRPIPANWPVAPCTSHVPLKLRGLPKDVKSGPLRNEWSGPQTSPDSSRVSMLSSPSVKVTVSRCSPRRHQRSVGTW